ncbi:DNA-processing protein DprA [uncultured Cetobacterium sp.]|uniref:DNA-processing protein DprA n=1 Tax=uncultured Cetobacterium sp. TaxID=527638 RepID=UPI0026339FC5|nr:DNA-processing protein DprA [uncultured Cetobacterium sp.]
MGWYRLKLNGLKSSKIRVLMLNYRRYKELLIEDTEVLKEKFNFDDEDIKIIQRSIECQKYIDFLEYLERNRIGIIDMNDYRYPELLKNISKPPIFIFFKGDINLLEKERMISIVGTRRATKYGEGCVSQILKDLVEADVVVVSGLALGIDTIAHQETLELKGKTIAVLGCGIDIIYPKGNIGLRRNIEKYGLVISEFPLGTKPSPQNFPIRNRIISGLSKGVLLIESALKGGSLITAGLALEEGRDVFAVPGDISAPFSKGCNSLIRDSLAKLIISGEDILKEYLWLKKTELGENLNKLIGKKLKIYNILKTKMHLEEIKELSGIETGELLGYLMEMEMERYVQSLPAGYYRRRV